MKKIYLLGNPVKHSKSPEIQNSFLRERNLDIFYDVLEIPETLLIETLECLEKDSEVIGLNITSPFKIKTLDWLISKGRNPGTSSVNTLYKIDNKFLGTSTDYLGAKEALKNYNLKEYKINILGDGGSSKIIQEGLRNEGITPNIFNRSNIKDFEEFNKNKKSITINATTVGMGSLESPVPENSIKENQVAFDLIYFPHETTFLKNALKNGSKVVYGIDMLKNQARFSMNYFLKSF